MKNILFSFVIFCIPNISTWGECCLYFVRECIDNAWETSLECQDHSSGNWLDMKNGAGQMFVLKVYPHHFAKELRMRIYECA